MDSVGQLPFRRKRPRSRVDPIPANIFMAWWLIKRKNNFAKPLLFFFPFLFWKDPQNAYLNWFLLGELALLLHNALDPAPIFHTRSQPIEYILHGWLPWRGSNVCLPDCAPEQRQVSCEALRTARVSEKVTLILTSCQTHNAFTHRKLKQWLYKCRILKELVTFTWTTRCFILFGTMWAATPWNPLEHSTINCRCVTLCLRHCTVVLHFSGPKGYSDTTMSQNVWLHYKPEAHKDISGFTVVVI